MRLNHESLGLLGEPSLYNDLSEDAANGRVGSPYFPVGKLCQEEEGEVGGALDWIALSFGRPCSYGPQPLAVKSDLYSPIYHKA